MFEAENCFGLWLQKQKIIRQHVSFQGAKGRLRPAWGPGLPCHTDRPLAVHQSRAMGDP